METGTDKMSALMPGFLSRKINDFFRIGSFREKKFRNKMEKFSVWHHVSKMPPEQFENVYHDFPTKVRSLLGDWLENQPWEFITGTDSFYTEMTNTLIQKLVEELEKISRTCGNEVHLVLRCAEQLKRMSQQDPVKIVLLFKSILEGEKSAVLKQFPRLWLNFSNKQEEMKFNVNIMMLQHKLKQATVIQQQLRHANENRSFPDQMQDVASLEMQWRMLCKDSFECLENAQSQAIKRINIWKRQQQLAGNGATFDDNLLPMQERMEILYNMHSDLHRIMKDMSLMGVQVPSELIERINSSLRTLITSSLLVDKQPPQVLKTQSKFQASVNFLLGHMTLRGPAKMPVVRAAIITEKRAQELYLAPASEAWNEGAGEIENGKSVLEITPNTKTCGAVFKNMLLKKIKRCERKGSESVTEEKCAMLFIAEINLNSCNMPFHVHALSLPLVVIVHGNQDNNAKATILWDNAFSEVERRPFFVEEKVPWSTMCKTLNMKFVSEVGTKQDLQPQQFLFLAQKIFNDNSLNSDDFKDRLVSWAQFNKEPLRERNFTFWQWFDGVVELTKKCLKNYWSDGLIIGFISKQYVHKILSNQPDGTFLLRFSDSEIGGITIAHILRREDGTTQIQNIQPFAAKDLNILSLGDRVRDLKQLKFLYPNKPKHEVFEKYYSKKAAKTADGYTPAIIIVTVAGETTTTNTDTVPAWAGDGNGIHKPFDVFQPTQNPNLMSPIYPPIIDSLLPTLTPESAFTMSPQGHIINRPVPLPVLSPSHSPLDSPHVTYPHSIRYTSPPPYPDMEIHQLQRPGQQPFNTPDRYLPHMQHMLPIQPNQTQMIMSDTESEMSDLEALERALKEMGELPSLSEMDQSLIIPHDDNHLLMD